MNNEEERHVSDVYDLRDLPLRHYRFRSREDRTEHVISALTDEAAVWEASLCRPEGGTLYLAGVKVDDTPNYLSEVGE